MSHKARNVWKGDLKVKSVSLTLLLNRVKTQALTACQWLTCIVGFMNNILSRECKIEFSIDSENAGKNIQVKL